MDLLKLVIEVPIDLYKTITAKTQADVVCCIDDKVLINAIKNGTPLPTVIEADKERRE